MCGIAGVFGTSAEAARRLAEELSTRLSHRGPDAAGLALSATPAGHLALGHRRLAIRDLSEAGAQPMTRPDGSSVIAYNGELYGLEALRGKLQNHGERFRGSSDTEVLLAALARYGVDVLDDLDGIFAFAWFDRVRNHLLLARDAFGVKPLYVTRGAAGFAFASEARPLARMLGNAMIRPEAAAAFLASGAIPQHVTPFADVESLPRGTWRRYDLARTTGLRPPVAAEGRIPVCARLPAPPSSFAEAASELRRRIDAVVASQLEADVPIGVFLSSGLDSAILATAAAGASRGVVAVTASLPESASADEAPAAKRVAARLGLRHEILTVSPASVRDELSAWLGALDQPSIDGWNTYLIARATRSIDLKVALSGLGADELFGGYPSFREAPRFARWPSALAALADAPVWRPLLRSAFGGIRAEKFHDLLAAVARGEPRLVRVTAARRRLFGDESLRGLGLLGDSPAAEREAALIASLAPVSVATAPAGLVVSAVESASYMGDMLLRDVDVASMAHGLEVRVPFLGRPIAEFAWALPDDFRVDPRGERKGLLRAAYPELLSTVELVGKKRGFVLPLAAWLRGPLADWEEVSAARLAASGLVEPSFLAALRKALARDASPGAASRRFALALLGHFSG